MRPLPLRPSPARALACTALLALPLALLACEDKPDKAPPSTQGASAFKEQPPPQAPTPAGTPPATPPPQAPVPGAPRPPEQLFADLGCGVCHGPGRAFASRLATARSKPDETVAVWILDPQKLLPGSMMPSFSSRLSTDEALSLARWIKAGNPVIPP